MSKLTIKVPTTKHISAAALNLKWHKPLSKKLQYLQCSACYIPLGNRRWGLAWVRVNKKERGMRLCEQCSLKAEADIKHKDNKIL